jgi:hypothetical protein
VTPFISFPGFSFRGKEKRGRLSLLLSTWLSSHQGNNSNNTNVFSLWTSSDTTRLTNRPAGHVIPQLPDDHPRSENMQNSTCSRKWQVVRPPHLRAINFESTLVQPSSGTCRLAESTAESTRPAAYEPSPVGPFCCDPLGARLHPSPERFVSESNFTTFYLDHFLVLWGPAVTQGGAADESGGTS